MGFNNPSVSWSEMERLLSDRRRPKPSPGDGGDSPAWSHKRGPYVAPPIERPAETVPYAEFERWGLRLFAEQDDATFNAAMDTMQGFVEDLPP